MQIICRILRTHYCLNTELGQKLYDKKGRQQVKIKFISVLVILLVTVTSFSPVVAETQEDTLFQYGIMDEALVQKDSITRKECIVSIMKLIGMTEEYAATYQYRSFYSSIFDDVERNMPSSDIGFNIDTDDIKSNIEDPAYGYIMAAGLYGIAYGEPIDRHLFNFYPDRTATFKEAIAFIFRCLGTSEKDIDAAYAIAEDSEFLSSTTWDNLESDSVLTGNTLYELLNRMLDMNCYSYFENGYMKDEVPTKSYRELLESR